jgi:NADP-dependent 3-hydroxy acid dehydrogenase YdfG
MERMADISKTVLITGASGGFGAYLSQAFAKSGYAVVLHGRDEAKLKNLSREIGAQSSIVLADLRRKEGIDAVISVLREKNVDVLVNNAAVNPELKNGAPINDFEDIDDVAEANMSSVIALCYAAFSLCAPKNDGIIVNINSVAGLRGSSHEAMYAASKFGLRGFSESVKEDWLKQGVKMIDVYPGAIGAGMSGGRPDVRKLIDPQELAEFLVSLCSPRSFFVKELNIRRTAV